MVEAARAPPVNRVRQLRARRDRQGLPPRWCSKGASNAWWERPTSSGTFSVSGGPRFLLPFPANPAHGLCPRPPCTRTLLCTTCAPCLRPLFFCRLAARLRDVLRARPPSWTLYTSRARVAHETVRVVRRGDHGEERGRSARANDRVGLEPGLGAFGVCSGDVGHRECMLSLWGVVCA